MDRVVHPPPRLLYTHSSPFCFRKQPSLGQQLRHFRRKDDVPARAFVLRGGQLVDPIGFAAPLVSGCVFRRTCTRIRRRSISRSIGWAACFLFRPKPLVNALPSFLLVDFVVGCELDRSKKPNPGKSLPPESRCTYSPGRGSTEEGSRCEYSQGAGGTSPPPRHVGIWRESGPHRRYRRRRGRTTIVKVLCEVGCCRAWCPRQVPNGWAPFGENLLPRPTHGSRPFGKHRTS